MSGNVPNTLPARQTCALSSIVALGIAVGFIGNVSLAEAASIRTWTFQNITFKSGQTASGSFTLNQDSQNNVIEWDIQIMGGSNPALTNIWFRPGENCLVFCSKGVFPSYLPGLDFRTALASDNTFFEMPIYLKATVDQIFDPTVTEIAVDVSSDIGLERLLDPNTVGEVARDGLSSMAIDARVVVVPEPSSIIQFTLVPLGLTVLACRNRTRNP